MCVCVSVCVCALHVVFLCSSAVCFFLCTKPACLIVLAQIMHAFSVAPFDQNLSINGKILSDDTATLGSLGVIPESVILLKVRQEQRGSGRKESRELSCFAGLFPCSSLGKKSLLKERDPMHSAGRSLTVLFAFRLMSQLRIMRRWTM